MSSLARGMKVCAILLCTLFLGALVWYLFMPYSFLLTICITLGIFSYHFVMRLLVGTLINGIFHNKIDYNLWWFKERRFEARLYKRLKVRNWAKKIPTYSPDTFSYKKHSWEEIAMATCQAEIVHEIIAVLSLLPILFIIPFGSALVFILTSVASALFDLVFVVVQRYNRPKILNHIKRCNARKSLK